MVSKQAKAPACWGSFTSVRTDRGGVIPCEGGQEGQEGRRAWIGAWGRVLPKQVRVGLGGGTFEKGVEEDVGREPRVL